MAKNSVVTIYDVAKLANVSMTTVSRVFNNPSKVNTATKERVLTVVEELGYIPNQIARELVMKKTTSINIVVSDIARTYVPQMLNGILNTANNLKCSLKIYSIDRNKSSKEFINYIIAEKTRGVILINDVFDEDEVIMMKDILKQINVCLTVLDTRIIGDNIFAYDSGVNAMKYLLCKI